MRLNKVADGHVATGQLVQAGATAVTVMAEMSEGRGAGEAAGGEELVLLVSGSMAIASLAQARLHLLNALAQFLVGDGQDSDLIFARKHLSNGVEYLVG